jgi:hypothetical protein
MRQPKWLSLEALYKRMKLLTDGKEPEMRNSLFALAALGFLVCGCASAAQRHQEYVPAPAKHERATRPFPPFDGACNPALHIRPGYCPPREIMWDHMWDNR